MLTIVMEFSESFNNHKRTLIILFVNIVILMLLV